MSTTEQRTGRVSPTKAEVDEARALAREVGLEYVDLDRYPLNAAAASLLPEQVARRHHALAVGWKYGTPVVAVAAPDNVMAMDDVRTVVGRDVHAVVACASQIDAYIERMYGGGGSARPAQSDPRATATPPSPGPVAQQAHGRKARREQQAAAAAAAAVAQAAPPEPVVGAEAAPVAPEAAPVAPEAVRDPAPVAVEAVPADSSVEVAAATEPAPLDRPGADPAPATPAPVAEPAALVDGAEAAPAETPELAGVPVHDETLVVAEAAEAAEAASLEAARAHPEGAGEVDKPSLAELLVISGQVTSEEMEAALRESSTTGRPLGEILSELGLVTEEDLIRAMAEELGMEFVDLNDFTIDPKATSLIPESMARRHQLLAIGFRGQAPIITMANPSNVFALDDLRTLVGRELVTVVSSPRQITEYISRMYRHDKEAADAARTAATQTNVLDAAADQLTDLHSVVEDAPIVKYVNLILRQAIQERASDVHIEPGVDDLRIRFRIDGVLHDVTRSPKAIQGGVTTRLKVMANLDIAEHRLPQDGRISLTSGNREIDLRVASLPTVHGEKIVMRILDKSNAMLDLSDLGFLPEVERRYEQAFRKPYGTILVTGPTGSGKSTTLYATLNALNVPERNLITVEDPVEYQLPGVNQVQVNPRAGLTFANALRSILRSDPDIILVGEIRDRETAVIGIEAAITGHLVLSSLHTNDAGGTPMRLVEMGVEPYLVGSALDCVVAQRLARQLCENCAETYAPTSEELALFGWTEEDQPPQGAMRFRRPIGCQACSRTGYRGRIALHELLIVSEEIERAVVVSAGMEAIQTVAVEQGMVTLRHDGLRKAALGLTSLEEVMRVVA